MSDEPVIPNETPPEEPQQPAVEEQTSVVEAAPETPPDSVGAAPAEGEEKPKEEVKPTEPSKPSRADRRIARLVAEREHFKAIAEGRITAAPVAPQQPAAPAFEKPAPKEEDFETIADFLDARAEYREDKREFERAQKQAQEQAKSAVEQQITTKQQADKAKFDSASQKYQDFKEVSNELGEIASDVMVNLLFKSEVFADLSYHLGKNIDEAERIAALPVDEQIYEIKSLEKRFQSSNPPNTPQPAQNQLNSAGKRTTQAPPPVPRAGGNEQATVAMEKLGYVEYCKRRGMRP